MTPALYCLLGFAMWTLLLLVVGVAPYRVVKVLTGAARANAFPAYVPHGPDIYQRVNRAHMNCVENLPVFGAVVLIGAVSGLANPTFDLLAQLYLVGRVGQSLAHISSGRSRVVHLRFAFFIAQLVCVVWMGALLAFR